MGWRQGGARHGIDMEAAGSHPERQVRSTGVRPDSGRNLCSHAGGQAAIPAKQYRHYKGKEYTVTGVARHSETEEELVVYRQEYGDHGLWVRPKDMFLETVDVAGQTVPRFKYLGPE